MTRSAGLALIAVLTIAGPARGEPPAAPANETARALLNEGLALRDKGELDGAIAKLRAAHALRATPITAFELGRAYADHAQLVEARDVLLSIKRMPIAPGESKDAQAARRDGAKLADDLKLRIPSLLVTFAGPGAALKPTLIIDGAAIPAEAAGEPQRLDPGKHHVIARVEGGAESAIDVELREAENARVVIDVAAPSARAPSAPPPAAAPRAEPSATIPTLMVYGGFSIALVGSVVGTITGLRAFDDVSTLSKGCSPAKTCTPDQAELISSARGQGNLSTVSFVVAGFGAAVGVVGLLIWPRAPVAVGVGSIGVRGEIP